MRFNAQQSVAVHLRQLLQHPRMAATARRTRQDANRSRVQSLVAFVLVDATLAHHIPRTHPRQHRRRKIQRRRRLSIRLHFLQLHRLSPRRRFQQPCHRLTSLRTPLHLHQRPPQHHFQPRCRLRMYQPLRSHQRHRRCGLRLCVRPLTRAKADLASQPILVLRVALAFAVR